MPWRSKVAQRFQPFGDGVKFFWRERLIVGDWRLAPGRGNQIAQDIHNEICNRVETGTVYDRLQLSVQRARNFNRRFWLSLHAFSLIPLSFVLACSGPVYVSSHGE